MDAGFISTVVSQGPYFALLCFFGYWFLMVYLPARDVAHQNIVRDLQDTFKEALNVMVDRVVGPFNAHADVTNSRLDTIEKTISKKK